MVAGWVIHLAPWVGISRTLLTSTTTCRRCCSRSSAVVDPRPHLERRGQRSSAGSSARRCWRNILPVAMATLGGWGRWSSSPCCSRTRGLLFSSERDQLRVGRAAVALYCVAILAVAMCTSAHLAPGPRSQARLGGAHVNLGLEVRQLDMSARPARSSLVLAVLAAVLASRPRRTRPAELVRTDFWPTAPTASRRTGATTPTRRTRAG